MSALEDRLLAQILDAGLPAPQREGRLVPGRRFRCDFFWAGPRVVAEVSGGTWAGGRHARGGGLRTDAEKSNMLQLAGWMVLTLTAEHIRSGDALVWIADALEKRGAIVLTEAT